MLVLLHKSTVWILSLVNDDKAFSHWGLREIAATLQIYIFKCILFNGIVCTLIQITLKFLPRTPVDNMLVLVQVVAWHRTNGKLLADAVLTNMYVAIWRQQATMS